MGLKFTDTRKRQKLEFAPIVPGEVRLYTCGPTVYNFAHIGNFRANIFSDLLRRTLKYKGFRVTQVMNLTDIDDKIIKAVAAKGVTVQEYTAPYTKAFFEDLDVLGIERAEEYPAATDHIDEMVVLIEALLERGHAYRANGDIYFKIATFPEYGQLSHMKLHELKDGARVSSDEYDKETASDFALWKGWVEADGDVFWETSLGKGRPGWHIECSAMSIKYLGNPFDMHTGGVDNIFPHHENEIAQTVCGTGERFADWWLHCEHLIVDGRKMSKSLGNYYTLRDILERGHSPMAVRYVLLATHYRQQLNFTFEGIDAARSAIERLRDFHRRLTDLGESCAAGGAGDAEVGRRAQEAVAAFEEQLDDDLNISAALGVVFDWVRDTNKLLDGGGVGAEAGRRLLDVLARIDSVVGVIGGTEEAADAEIDRLIEERNAARKAKDFGRADEIRDELQRQGIILEDAAGKTRWKRSV